MVQLGGVTPSATECHRVPRAGHGSGDSCHPLAVPALSLPFPWELTPPARAALHPGSALGSPSQVIDARSAPSHVSGAVNGEKTEEVAP